jgi:hypothetical protein
METSNTNRLGLGSILPTVLINGRTAMFAAESFLPIFASHRVICSDMLGETEMT